MANLLTMIRVALIFVVIGVWARDAAIGWWWLDLLMVPLLAWAIFMDALDGWVARRRREESDVGALFDIAGDRIVELALWAFFAIRRGASGDPLVPYWVPLVMIARTVLTDFVRSVAFQAGRTPFGERTLQRARWARELVSSRWSRALYGGMKAVAFCAVGLLYALERAGWGGAGPWWPPVLWLVYATTVFGVLRAVPVVWEGRRFLVVKAAR